MSGSSSLRKKFKSKTPRENLLNSFGKVLPLEKTLSLLQVTKYVNSRPKVIRLV
jgi:hypothetical protein